MLILITFIDNKKCSTASKGTQNYTKKEEEEEEKNQ